MEQKNSRRRFRALRFTRNHLVFGVIAFVVLFVGFGQRMMGGTPAQSSLVVTASPLTFNHELSVLDDDRPRSIMVYICTGYTCSAQQDTIEEVAVLYADRLKIIQLQPDTIPEVTRIIVQALGGEAYPMYFIRTPGGDTKAAAGMMTVAQLSQMINATIGGPAQNSGGTATPGQSQMPVLRNIVVFSQENADLVQARAESSLAVYTILCASHDPVCVAQLGVLDAAAATRTNVLFVYFDSEQEASLQMLVEATRGQVLQRLATPAHIISNRAGGITSWVGFIGSEQIASFIDAGLAAVPATQAAPPTATPQPTQGS